MKGILFTYALMGLGIFGVLRSPLIGLAIYVCFAVLRPQFMWGYAHHFVSLSWFVGVAALLSWGIHGFGSWQFGKAKPIVWAFVFYGVWSVLSAAQAANDFIAWRFVENTSKTLLPFLVGATLIRSQKWAMRMLWIIVLSQGYVAFHINEAYFFLGFNEVHEVGYGGMDNNSVAIAFVTVLGPALGLAVFSKDWRAKAVAAAAALFLMHGAQLTFSRGAMVGLLVVALVFLLVIPKRPKFLLIATIGLLIAIRLTGPQLAARYRTAFNEETTGDYSITSRLDLWADCLSVAFDHPLFGVGPDHWPLVASQYGWSEGKEAHSVWLQGAAELGFPGVLALFAIFGFSIIKCWPVARSRDPADGDRKALATGVVLGAVGYIVSGQFVSLEGLEVPYYLMMTGAGLLASPRAEDRTAAVQRVAPTASLRPETRPLLARARRVGPSVSGSI